MPERKVLRLKDYNYSSYGFYYITLLIKNRECLFGQIVNDNMILNEYGTIAKECWDKIHEIYPFINLDEHIIMPNHIHGLIEILDDLSLSEALPMSKGRIVCGPYSWDSSWKSALENDRTKEIIPKIIQQYKSAVTKKINELNKIYFQWHRSYYDHIVRDEDDLNHIREYIIYNPVKWNEDDNNNMSLL